MEALAKGAKPQVVIALLLGVVVPVRNPSVDGGIVEAATTVHTVGGAESPFPILNLAKAIFF
ncbi:MAG: hypothetical protein ACI97A_003002 [Planctomycetota bacterium]